MEKVYNSFRPPALKKEGGSYIMGAEPAVNRWFRLPSDACLNFKESVQEAGFLKFPLLAVISPFLRLIQQALL